MYCFFILLCFYAVYLCALVLSAYLFFPFIEFECVLCLLSLLSIVFIFLIYLMCLYFLSLVCLCLFFLSFTCFVSKLKIQSHLFILTVQYFLSNFYWFNFSAIVTNLTIFKIIFTALTKSNTTTKKCMIFNTFKLLVCFVFRMNFRHGIYFFNLDHLSMVLLFYSRQTCFFLIIT